MKENFINKGKAYFFITAIIILSGILIFYLSCKSKSPTESSASLHNQVAAQSTNNTTTSSSTTTSVRPGNTPTNTTTLITSRTLTTTSTSTSTTSTTSTSTTTSRPITTITTTTSIHVCDIRLCEVTVNGTPVQNGDTVIVTPVNYYVVAASFANHGTMKLLDAQSKIISFVGTGGCGLSESSEEYFGKIPANGKCIGTTDLYTLEVNNFAPNGFTATLSFMIFESKQCTSLPFTIFFQVINTD